MSPASKNASQAENARRVLDNLRDPVIMIDKDNLITFANLEAEYFFSSSMANLANFRIDEFVGFSNPLLTLIDQVRLAQSPTNEYRVDVSSPRLGLDRTVDIHVTPVAEEDGAMVIVFRERSMAEKFDRQMTHRGAARSVTGLASMLGHEIKNPLSGIRGAAQLLESVVSDEDRALAQLIKDECDRIVQLVDKMEVFSDERPLDRDPVNIHVVLDRVQKIAKSGFGRNIEFKQDFDPSLPYIAGNQDQLIQVFLNLVKNACEAVANVENPKIRLKTAYQPGVRLSIPGLHERVSLPLEFSVQDNGPGVPEEIQSYMFDPFITTKTNGSGLGLALVAKIVGDHGGVIECDSQPGNTKFKILMPTAPKAPS
ncbi:two-component system sensor histidine kinase NtrB [Ahrensia kielensis]|uniref:two-component system sensor histidine kinase NtrB n=1 Tax=Ahrensia kielensis TaxID=76980 RepID=UPI000376E524|nr:nitrogen regulation protein NR(II) [Ahrensia kielensis]